MTYVKSALALSVLVLAAFASPAAPNRSAVPRRVPQARSTVSQPAVPHFPTAASARQWGENQERAGNFAAAAVAFDAEAAMYDTVGDHQGAQVERRRARRLSTSLVLAVPSPDAPLTVNRAKLEPARGCYLGVRDDPNGRYWGRHEANTEDFARRLGVPVSVAFDYNVYGKPFPVQWALRQAEHHRAIQIAWEPNNIDAVDDNDYLNDWAREAGKSGVPVFLRFGGEMNGAWTRWGRNPRTYRIKFRLVHEVMARYAPNVAMVWAPNAVPVTNLDLYYPGDDVVDWVGISLYLVRFYDDNLSRPGWQDSPSFYIDPFYRKYAAKKPLCLVECGVTRQSRVEAAPADQFAAARIQDLFDCIKIRYPRLKMVCLFDRNNIEHAIPGRQLNDFSLPEGSLALAAMRAEAQDPYFLTQYSADASAPIGYVPIRTNFPKGYTGPVAASLSTYALNPILQARRNSVSVRSPRPFVFELPPGDGPLVVTVLDGHGKPAYSQTTFVP